MRRVAIHLNHLHAWAYAHTRGRLGGRMGGHPVLLLTTVGRRSGTFRRTPVQFERIDGDLVLVAAAGGAPAPPAWWRNLKAEPGVTVQIGRDVLPMRAITVNADERRELWPRLCEANRRLASAERRAGRELPLVRLVDPTATRGIVARAARAEREAHGPSAG